MSIRSCLLILLFGTLTPAAFSAQYWKTDTTFTSPLFGRGTPIAYSSTLPLPNGGLALALPQNVVNGKLSRVLEELKADGTTDTSFSADGNLATADLVSTYPDGRLIIRGSTKADNNQKYFRLLANGTIDASFNAFSYSSGSVPTIVAQPDGKLLVFEQGSSLQRFNADGTADTTFASPFVSPDGVRDLTLQSDGKMIVSGSMMVANSNTLISFARLNTDGSIDSSFQCALNQDPHIQSGAWSFIDSGGQLYVYAYDLTSSGEINKLDATGNSTANYAPAFPSSSINPVMKPLANGMIYFINSGPSPAQLQRVNIDGTFDNTFSVDVSLNSPPLTWDGTYIYLTDGPPARVASHEYITQVDATGHINNAFNPLVGELSSITSFYRQSDGKYFVSADADAVNGAAIASDALIRLNSDGSFDNTFQPNTANTNSTSTQIQGLPLGAVISLQQSYATQELKIVQQDSSGAILANNAQPSTYLLTFASDGSYYTYIQSTSASSAVLSRYKKDGSLDSTFAPSSANAAVQDVRVIYPAPNGKIYLLGYQSGLQRLNQDGSADSTFTPQIPIDQGAHGAVVLPDSSVVYIDGNATTTYTHYDVNGTPSYVYEGDDSILTLAGVIYDRLKAISATTHAFGTYGATPFDIAPNGQLSVLSASGNNAILSRYLPTNSAQATVPLAPSISTQPAGGTASLGGAASLSVHATGLHPFTYQWYLNGKSVPGATSDTLSLPTVTSDTFGDYTVVVTNSAGSITSAVATLTAVTGPNITQQPVSVTTSLGAPASFTASTDVGFSTYEWQVLSVGSNTWTDLSETTTIHGTRSGQLTIDSVTSDLNGASFRCRILDVNTGGTSYSSPATLTIPGAPAPVSVAKFSNISTRAYVGTGASIEIGGFIISGTQPKQVLIRGLGPQLTGAGVKNALADPVLKVFAGQTQIATNDDWSSDPANAAAVTNASIVGNAIAFPDGSKDAALVLTLNPGAGYTAQLTGKNGATGIGMIEVYEADSTSTDSKLINISTRSETQTGAGIQIAGFIISGSQAKTVLIRALGPTLTQSSVKGVLDDPVLSLFSQQTKINENDDWSSTADNTSAVEAATTSANAVALSRGTTDSAMVVTLAPGGYTAQVSGKNGHTGVTLIEVYEVP